MWKLTDGEAGIDEIHQWLVNIQARAANSPVIIVGTHYDEIVANEKKFPPDYLNHLQQMIRGGICIVNFDAKKHSLDRFVAVPDADKRGLPRVTEAVIVSSKTKYNIQHLAQLVYSTAVELRTPGSKERLLEQKIPASYLALEEVCFVLVSTARKRPLDHYCTG